MAEPREPNGLYRRPPHTSLGGSGALARLDLSEHSLELGGTPSGEQDPHAAAAAADLKDGFFQVQNRRLASYVGVEFGEPASVWGVSEVYDEHSESMVAVHPDDTLYFVLEALPMGWTWALFFCQDALEDAIINGLECDSATGPGLQGTMPPLGGLIQDGRPCPVPGAGRPAAAAYVDNMTIIGACKSDTERGYERVCDALRSRGFVLHDLAEASREVETVGIVFEGGGRRRLRAKPARTWRIYQSISFLLQRQGCTGHIMEKLLGHVVNHFMLARSAMSALDLMYKFIDHSSTHMLQRFDTALCHELKVVQGLLFLAEIDMAAPRSEIVFCGDSSKKSFRLVCHQSRPYCSHPS